MLTAVIVDDEQPAIDLLRLRLEETGMVQCIGTYRRPSEAVSQLPQLQPDVVFLDVEMPGINGIELAEHVTDQLPHTQFVFVTAFRNYAVEAFELNAVDYLVKPALQSQVERAIGRVLQRTVQRQTLKEPHAAQSRIRAFGLWEVRTPLRDEIIKWRTAKVEELLAYLVYYRGIVVRKSELIDTLWPDCDLRTADNNLHTTVYKLKKTLKEQAVDISITFSGGGYIARFGAQVDYDVERFETFSTAGKTLANSTCAEFESHIELYQGEYLEGKEYAWCLTERAKLQEYFSSMVKQLAHHQLARQNYKRVEQLLLKNIRYAPYDEDAYEMLLLSCFYQGDTQGIVRNYEAIRQLLSADLSIEPRPSLKRLYDELINKLKNS